MSGIWRVAFVLVFFGAAALAQEALPPAIWSAYDATFKAMQSAKSAEDIHRMVEAMDSLDWVSIGPNGDRMSRDEAEKQLLGLLSIPTGQRPEPLRTTIYVGEAGSSVAIVYWVYRITGDGPVGSIVRDTWNRTPAGWRRSLHEKLFPDRLLKLP